jgi:hypothetical protein
MPGTCAAGEGIRFYPEGEGTSHPGPLFTNQTPHVHFRRYNHLRHCLAAQRWWVLLPLLILVPMQIRNSRKERELLLAKFGDAYLDYDRKTWF